MIRNILLPLVASAALAGCVTPHAYRSGNGDYYHGSPSVEIRNRSPYPYYSPYGYGVYGGYGQAPYGYQRYIDRYGRVYYVPAPYYGRGWNTYPSYPYGYPYRHGTRPRVDHTPDGTRSPWRNLDGVRRGARGGDGNATGGTAPTGGTVQGPSTSSPVVAPRSTTPAPRAGGIGGRIQRAKTANNPDADSAP